ncbi:MAG: bifunctional rhamnulose-1-phosphate aldolase/short-chain dehydrogenase [Devosiaceae bacterium]|nr:bifunctional rhamnulose-1-phosphate aldolase/short-chain dehydrogenase [Devosiaceae bacterium]
MTKTSASTRIKNLWDASKASLMDEAQRLEYRSNLLGSDKRVTNFGGGNTSSKIICKDPLGGKETEVLWVKGSGGDLGTIKLGGFATLYMDRLQALKSLYRGVEFEDEMVAYLAHCTFNLNARAASIDTPLHAYVPKPFVDHMHPDAIIAIAAAKEGKELTREIFGQKIGWLPWKRPGFELGMWLEKFCVENPEAQGVILENHGLFTWADTSEQCYETTITTINTAIEWLKKKSTGIAAFGGNVVEILSAGERRRIAAILMPKIRGMISKDSHKVGHFDDCSQVLEFVSSSKFGELAALGTSCPDHFLRTKIRPMVIDFDPENPDIDATLARLEPLIEVYRGNYAAYYQRCRHDDSPAMRDVNPVVYLVPGVGMITFAADKATARISGEFYVNAINVMRGASSVSTYRGLDEQEAFNIEYWLLEEAKLQRLAKPKSLAGRVAFVTGGAGGIGRATAARMLHEGACIVLGDIDQAALEVASAELKKTFGADFVRSVQVDVANESQVINAMADVAVEFGGLDILVSNAGFASAAPIQETSLELWEKNMSILATGYFLVSREAFKMFITQENGGNVVFVASKNGLVASPNAAAYCTAKAGEIHLARCLALEGAGAQIRVNVVNPDAVLRGSKIWTGEWRKQRAAAYDKSEDELEEHYRQRSLLKRMVLPQDIAEAVYFFASDASAKSTGNIINVDAGNAQAFTR